MTDTPPVVEEMLFLEPDDVPALDEDASNPENKGWVMPPIDREGNFRPTEPEYPTDSQPEPGVVDKMLEQEREE